ncbi:MAG: signal peptidase I, partial [Myxococcales bacterium]|nr:signal peptidase I [Myxococcales bacterium]
SPRQVRSAARILHKEARKILKKYASRLAAEAVEQMRECMAGIERLRDRDDQIPALQAEAERLDELLEQHASFARKSALRETLENIGIAVIIALGLRSCLYEPFKIPSGSMMPTLRTGDHIFVNKFVYGVQIPFTTTVVGESWGQIERGDVIVFRYPLDETQDFIKRVVGLPGDEVRVTGRRVEVKHAGDDEFTVLEHERLEQRCYDNEGDKPIANCTLYQETHGDKAYVVRYKLNAAERGELAPPPQTWKVPEGHLMVMGDNRNDSLDSRRWTVQVEAVKADGLLTTKDLRDLTDERLFSMTRPDYVDAQADFSHDHVIFKASHRALDHDLALEVWRDPTLGAESIAAAKVGRLAGARSVEWDALVGEGQGPQADALRRHGEAVAAAHLAHDPDGQQLVVRLEEPAAVLSLRCGRALCPDEPTLAATLGGVLERFEQNRDREARELLARPSGSTSYSSQFKSRQNPRDHYYERRFASPEDQGRRASVWLRAFRRPEDGTELVRDAALVHYGLETDAEAGPQPQVDDNGVTSWLLDDDDAWVGIAADTAREMVVVLECGKSVCRTEERARAVMAGVYERLPRAAGDRRRLPQLLGTADLDGLPEVPAGRLELAEYDRVALEATVKGDAHSVEVEAWLRPPQGLSEQIAALVQHEGGMEADDALMPGAYAKSDQGVAVLVFPVPESETVVRLRCHPGLCPTRQTAVSLARRAANRAQDPENFVDPEAERPQPFVPRGNVKGRADRIWLPLSRFWLPIR